MLRDGKIISDKSASINAFYSDGIIVYMCDTHIRLEIEIEIGLNFDQSKQSSLNLRLVFFLPIG